MIDTVAAQLRASPRRWLVTGAAGFIGSHLVQALLALDQEVTGLDNFATGHRRNLDEVRDSVGREQWARWRFVEGDIRDPAACRAACTGARVVLHQAALGSVPRSIEAPLPTHEANVTGFLNMMVAARDAGAHRFVYASSSSVYGDHPDAVRTEAVLGQPLSPYAASKRADELYAAAFAKSYGFAAVGLRYFNVFGPRQDPEGPYAAVIPRWAASLLAGDKVRINGDGETSRDFCYIANVVQANLLAATADPLQVAGQSFNVGAGGRTTLRELFDAMRAAVSAVRPEAASAEPELAPFRAGDVRHSQADIAKARRELGYEPSHALRDGLAATLQWYTRRRNER
jgi:UDP-N-acetylglucosamine 4-epimerase